MLTQYVGYICTDECYTRTQFHIHVVDESPQLSAWTKRAQGSASDPGFIWILWFMVPLL